MRLFEEAIGGELGKGELGFLASPRGVGKTAVLVQIGLDRLLQGKKVLHVSFAQRANASSTFTWYEDILAEFVSGKQLEGEADLRELMSRNRILMNLSQDAMGVDRILRSLKAMICEGGFAADTLIVDGFDFSRETAGYLAGIKGFAAEAGLSVWHSCTAGGEGSGFDAGGIPLVLGEAAGLPEVVVLLEPKAEHVELSVSRGRAAKAGTAKLDPKTLLLLG
ncbi:MAG: hypothetical protein FWD94_03545 [Treponema sp.]|jgi:hypothetical protein|nr:hypothetical protein [Treponema sp.]